MRFTFFLLPIILLSCIWIFDVFNSILSELTFIFLDYDPALMITYGVWQDTPKYNKSHNYYQYKS